MNREKKSSSIAIGEDSKRSGGERSEPERSVESSPIAPTAASGPLRRGQEGRQAARDPEVPEKAQRRRYSAEYKLRILREADACEAGQVGSLLRREGLYWSTLQTWRRQRDEGTIEGLSARKRGRKPAPRSPLAGKVHELERENRRLRRKVQRAEILLDIQKKASELLGISLASLEKDEEDD